MAIFCKKCGAKLEDDAVFCVKCGNKIVNGGSSLVPAQSSGNGPRSSHNIQSSNRYAGGPEYASKEDTLSWWSYKGRLNRERYIYRTLILTVIGIVLGIIVAGVMSFFITAGAMTGGGGDEVLGLLFLFCVCSSPFFLPLYVISTFTCIKRGHDLNMAGWIVICISLLLPSVTFGLSSLVFYVYLACAKGNEGPNQYGEDPLKYPGSI